MLLPWTPTDTSTATAIAYTVYPLLLHTGRLGHPPTSLADISDSVANGRPLGRVRSRSPEPVEGAILTSIRPEFGSWRTVDDSIADNAAQSVGPRLLGLLLGGVLDRGQVDIRLMVPGFGALPLRPRGLSFAARTDFSTHSISNPQILDLAQEALQQSPRLTLAPPQTGQGSSCPIPGHIMWRTDK